MVDGITFFLLFDFLTKGEGSKWLILLTFFYFSQWPHFKFKYTKIMLSIWRRLSTFPI